MALCFSLALVKPFSCCTPQDWLGANSDEQEYNDSVLALCL